MKIVILGISRENGAPLDLLERVAFTPEILSAGLDRIQSDCCLLEAVLISTCQRTEIVGVVSTADSKNLPQCFAQSISDFHDIAVDEIEPHVHAFEPQLAVEHLFRVAAGIESIALGENQIQGQIRESYGVALSAENTGKITSKLFQDAVRVGKRIRTETDIGKHPISISSLAVDLAEDALGGLAGKRALIVGSGEMSEIAAKSLRKRGIAKLILVNRTYGRAKKLAESLGGDVSPWEALQDVLCEVDVVISSTAAPHTVIDKDQLEEVMNKREQPLFLVDIAMPRDIEPDVSQLENVHLYNLDDLKALVEKNKEGRQDEVPQALSIINSEVAVFLDWMASLETLPTVTAIRERAEEMRANELQKAMQRAESLSAKDQEIFEQMSRRIVTKLLHNPTVELKKNGDPNDALDSAARRLFGLDETHE
jgi:glutamyl-tRNA reductase